jgi:hypothetical protein
MSFLFPTMLLGLAGLAIPVVIHLIARHKYQVQEFPSVRLLLPDERANVFAMRLVDIGQLLLRLLVILVLVLAMSRLFASWWPFGQASRNLVVVVDCSASMNMASRGPAPSGAEASPGPREGTAFARAKSKARELLAAVQPPGQCALVAAGQEAKVVLPLSPTSRRVPSGIEGLKTSDGAGRGLVHVVARCCDMVRGRREARSQIVVLTDLCSTAFEARNQQDLGRIEAARGELGSSLEIVLMDVSSGRADNLALVDASTRGQRIKVGDDAHVVARVLNSSDKEKMARLRLAVGGRAEPSVKEVALGPGAEADVDLTLRMARTGQTFADVGLESDDALPHDNASSVPLSAADARRILIVRGEAAAEPREPSPLGELGTKPSSKPEPEEALDGAKILRLVLNPGRELGRPYGTGIQTTVIARDALGDQPLSKYDLVVLYGVSSLPDQALRDLEAFVRQGHSLLFVCSSGTNAMKFNRTFAASGAGGSALSPAELGNERSLDPPIGIRLADGSHPLLAPFRDRLKGDLSAARFTSVRELRELAKGATVLIAGTDGLPLAVEMPLGHGRIALLAFGVELQHGNVARTRVFPVLTWQLVSYLTGDLRARPPDVLTASRPAVLDVSELPFAFLNELELGPAEADREAAVPPARLPISGDRMVLLAGLPAGHYLLRKPQEAPGSSQPEWEKGKWEKGTGPLSRNGLKGASLPSRDRQGAATRPLANARGSVSPFPIQVYARHIAVNPDPRESRTARIGEGELAKLFGGNVRVLRADDAVAAPQGGELWSPLIVLLALAYAAEGAIGWLLSVRREKQRVAGASE